MKKVRNGKTVKVGPDHKGNMVQFLETWAPLRKFREPVSDHLGNRAHPAIHMHCPNCGSAQTFNIEHDKLTDWIWLRLGDPYDAELWRYRCMGCSNYGRLLLLETGEDGRGTYIRKLGQKPDWEASLDPQLERLLGAHAAMFRRGLDCEGTGYGIGAYAYYRRIVEDTIGNLLDRIPALLSEAERPRYAAVLEEVHKATVAQTKIELVKDLLPTRLRPEGINPLDVLHTELSIGLHGKSDEDCLDDAEAVRSAISYLLVELARAEDAGKTFTAGMRNFLDKRSGK